MLFAGSFVRLLFAAVIAQAAPVPAAAPLTLAQAIAESLTGNLDLRKERLGVATAEANVTAAEGAFDFLINGGARFTRSTTPAPKPSPLTAGLDLTSGYTNTFDLNLGLARPLESGGSVSFNVQGTRIDTSQPIQTVCISSGPCVYYVNTWSLTFSQPLLRNFGREIATANLRSARVQKDLALLSRQTRAAVVLRDVVAAYWELAYATQELAIRQSAVELAREQLRITRAQIEVGRLSRLDSASVERAINDRLGDVALAEQALRFRGLDLRRLLGMPVDAGAAPLVAADAPAGEPLPHELAAELSRALESNPQLRSARAGLALRDIDVVVAASLLKPRLDFVGQLGTTGRDTSVPDAFAGARTFDNLIATAGLTFQLPVQNRAARGSTAAARLERESAAVDATAVELDIRDAVSRRVIELDVAARRLQYARAAVGFAQQNLEAEQARFSVGRSTNNDVLLRQQELKQNQLQVVRAQVDVLLAEVTLAALTGEVLERHGVYLKGS